jgi:hypothetical protein
MKGIRHGSRRSGVHPSGVRNHDKFPNLFQCLRAFVANTPGHFFWHWSSVK